MGVAIHSHPALIYCGVFNAPCRPRGRVQSEAFRDRLPTAVGHTACAQGNDPHSL